MLGPRGTNAATCPMLAGESYGPPSWQPDGSADENTYYRYVTQDDYMKLDSIYYCLDAATQTHLQGFIATFENTETEQKQAFPYGETNTGDDSCEGFYVKDEAQWIRVKQDDDDITGLVIGNAELGTTYPFMTKDMADPDPRDTLKIPLMGRLIGFGVTTAKSTRGDKDQIVRLSIVYNRCNCVGSSFQKDNPPVPMRIVAGVDPEVLQDLAFRTNSIQRSYGQNCGGQTVSLMAQVDPSPLDIVVSSSGAPSIWGDPYIDTIRIGQASEDLIGRWNFALQYSQQPGQGAKDKFGEETLMDPLMMPFFVQVDPCPVEELTASVLFDEITYTVGEGEKRSMSYLFEQTPCNYNLNINVSPMLPGFISVDPATNQFVIETDDEANVGDYVFVLTAKIQEPTDYTKSDFNEIIVETEITLTVLSNTALPPGCEDAQFDVFSLSDMNANLNDDSVSFQLEPVQDSESRTQGNGDGFSYCKERKYQIVNAAQYEPFLTLDETNKLVLNASQESEVGQYEVEIMIFFERDPLVNSVQTMTVTVNPCKVSLYAASKTLADVDYEVSSGPLTTEKYEFAITPLECSYDAIDEVSGGPDYVVHNTDLKNFLVESDDASSETYLMTVTSTIEVPTDYTYSSYETLTQSFTFSLIVDNPNEVDCETDAEIEEFALSPMQTSVYGELTEQILPPISEKTGECGDIALEIVEAATFSKYLNLDQEQGLLTLESQDPAEIGLKTVQVKAYLIDYPEIEFITEMAVTVNPCQITDMTFTIPDSQYTIGSGQKQTDPFTVEILPFECATFYGVAQTYTTLPSFVQSDSASQVLSIETDDRTQAEILTIDLTLSLMYPKDYTMKVAEAITITSSQSFTITVQDPCETTELDDFTINDVLISLLGEVEIRPLPMSVPDSASKTYGNQDGTTFCGERIYTIDQLISYSEFITVNEVSGQMEFQSSQTDTVGRYTVQISTELTDYPAVTKIATFVVTVNPCQISSFTGSTSIDNQDYLLGSETETTLALNFIQVNACGYPEELTFIDLPDFMTFNEATRDFSIFTDDLNDAAAQYSVTVRNEIEVPKDYTYAESEIVTAEVTLTVNVIAGCDSSSFKDWILLDESPITINVKSEPVTVAIGPVEDSVSRMSSNKDGFTHCGQREYKIVDDSSVSNFALMDTSALTLVFTATEDSMIGLYTIDVQVSLKEHPDVKLVAPLTIIINPCQVSSFTGSASVSSLDYLLGGETETNFDLDFVQVNACGYAQKLTFIDLPDFMTFSIITKEFTIFTDDLDDTGTQYSLTVINTIEVPKDYTYAESEFVTAEVMLKVNVIAGCDSSSFKDWILLDESPITMNVKSEPVTVAIGPVEDSVSLVSGNKDGFTHCGQRAFKIVDDSSVSNFALIDTEALTLVFTATEDTMIGLFTIDVQVSLKDHPDVKLIASLTIIVNPCKINSFTGSASVNSLDYLLGSEAETTFALNFIQVNACDYPEELTFIDLPDFMTFNIVTKEFSIFTEDLNNAATQYSITVINTIEVPKDYTYAESEVTTAEVTLTINVIAGCDSSSFKDWTLLDESPITMNVKDEPITVAIGPVEDSVSRVSGNKDGFTHCGLREYKIIDDSSISNFVLMDTEALTLVFTATEDTMIGLYTIDVQVSLKDFPDVKLVAPLTIIINPCQVTTITHSLTNQAIAYAISSPMLTDASYSFKQVKNCGYTPIFELQDLPTFVTHNESDQSFSVYTDNLLNEGDYTITVVSKLNVAKTYQETDFEEVSDNFKIVIKVVNSCKVTNFDQVNLLDMTGSVNGKEISQTFDEVKDAASKQLGNQDGLTFCNDRSYEIIDASLHANYLQLVDRTITVKAESDSDVGSHLVQLKISLAEYPEVSIIKEFTVTVDPCQVSEIEILSGPSDVSYEIKTPIAKLGTFSTSQGSCNYDVTYTVFDTVSFLSIEDDAVFVETDDEDLSDQYTIGIIATIQVPTDSENTQFNELIASYAFNLDLELPTDPCETTVFDEFVIQDMKTSVLGDAVSVSFDQQADQSSRENGDLTGHSFCGERAYSLKSNQPAALVFDPELRTLKLETQDSSQIGEYSVEVQVQLVDYPTITKSALFKVTIDPCQITEFTGTLTPGEFTYGLGDPARTSFAYSFAQMNQCGYTQDVTIDKSLSFLTHNTDTNNFTIETSDTQDAGIHVITVTSTIKVPTDFTKTSFTEQTAEVQFTITIVNGCESTKLLPFTMQDIIAFEKDGIVFNPLPNVEDSLAKGSGIEDQCGKRQFKVLEPSDFFSILIGKLAFNTDVVEPNKDFYFEIQVSLLEYPDVEAVTSTVLVKLDNCKVQSIVAPDEINLVYYVRTPEVSVQFQEFEQQPNCDLPFSYSHVMSSGNELPSFMDLDLTSKSLTVQSDDISDQGSYSIIVTGFTPAKGASLEHSASVQINVQVKFDCAQDRIETFDEFENIKVALKEGNSVSVTPSFTQILESCPESFKLQKLSATGWQNLTPLEASILRITNTVTGEFIIDGSQRDFDGQKWTIKMTISNSNGSQNLQQEFDLTFTDACWNAVLQPVYFYQNSYSFSLYKDTLKVEFTPMEVDLDCGAKSYELKYVSGPRAGFVNEISFLGASLVSQLNDKNWAGTHTLKVKAINGKYNPQSNQGNDGVFGSILSDSVTITIKDPCLKSVISADTGFPEFIGVPVGEKENGVTVTGPRNSVSLFHGNGYDLCGPLKYQLLDATNLRPTTSQNFDIKVLTDLVDGDKVTLTVTSDSVQGPLITKKFFIKVSLKQYQSASTIQIPISISYRECDVQKLKALEIVDQTISYQSIDPIVIYYDFDQGECAFEQTTKAVIVVRDYEYPLPEFIKLSTEQESITISPPQSSPALGEYKILLKSALNNSEETQSEVSFLLNIINEQETYEPFYIKPEFKLELQDQVVTVGHSFNYEFGFSQTGGTQSPDSKPFMMFAYLSMQKIKDFAQYDSVNSALKIDGQKLNDTHVGFYTIGVAATFSNGTYSETQSDKFRLEVRPSENSSVNYDSDTQDKEEIPASNKIYLSEWKGLIVDTSANQFNKQQPIPYVQDLSETGVLSILWDRQIREITDTTEIPPTEVVIRNSQSQSAQSRRLQQFWLGDYYGSVDGYEKVEVKRALEIKMLRQDQDDKVLDWTVLETNANLFKLQINFDQEDMISSTPEVAYLKVTFWGTEFFQSVKDGEQVRLGTTLEWPILNQITQEQAEKMSEYRTEIRMAVVCVLAAMVPFCSIGTLLPTWIFLNTLQLVSHLPMLSMHLPPIVQSSLIELLSYCKLDMLIEFAGFDLGKLSFGNRQESLTFDQIRLACGYSDQYVQIIPLVFGALIVLSLLQVIVQNLLRCLTEKNCSNKCGSLPNMTFRLAYLFFLEITVSLYVNLSPVAKSMSLGPVDPSEQTSLVTLMSIAIAAMIVITILALLTALVFGCGIGPQDSDLYSWCSFWKSCYEPRPLQNNQALIQLIQSDKELMKVAKDQNSLRLHQKLERKMQDPLYVDTQLTARKLLTTESQQNPTAEHLFSQHDMLSQGLQFARNTEQADKDLMGFELDNIDTPKIQLPSHIPCTEQVYTEPEIGKGFESGNSRGIAKPVSNVSQLIPAQAALNSIEYLKPLNRLTQKKMLTTFHASSIDQRTSDKSSSVYQSNFDGNQNNGTRLSKKTFSAGPGSMPISGMSSRAGSQLIKRAEMIDQRAQSSVYVRQDNMMDHNLAPQSSPDDFQSGNIPINIEKTAKPANELTQQTNQSSLPPIREADYYKLQADILKHFDAASTPGSKPLYEGGEQDLQEEEKSMCIESLPELPQSIRADQQASQRSSMCGNPQSLDSRRAQTKLNQRGIDLAIQDLSYESFNKQKHCESVKLAHGFANISRSYSQGDLERVEKISKEETFTDQACHQLGLGSPFMQDINAELDYDEIVLDGVLLAKLLSKLEDKVTVSRHYRTLFNGLKLNTPRKVAIVHPLQYLVRRLIFVATAIYFVSMPVFSMLAFMSLTLVMLAQSLHEKQWKQPAVNCQHILNEIIVYSLTTLLLLCNGSMTVDMINIAGLVVLGLLGLLIVTNSLFMTFNAARLARLCLRRLFNKQIIKNKKTQAVILKLDVNRVISSLKSENTTSPKCLEDKTSGNIPLTNFVKVQSSRRSLVDRIFKSKVTDVVSQENVLTTGFDDNEAIQVVASNSGGFRGRLKSDASRGDQRVMLDRHCDAMGIFSQNIVTDSNEFRSSRGLQTDQDKMGGSQFEFQSSNAENIIIKSNANQTQQPARKGIHQRFMSDLELLISDQQSDVQNDPSRQTPEKDGPMYLPKPYLHNDLNSISQAHSIMEGTPSPNKTDELARTNQSGILSGTDTNNFMNIEQEVTRFALDKFNDEVHPVEEVQIMIGQSINSAKQFVSPQEGKDLPLADEDLELTPAWSGLKINEVNNRPCSIIQELDEVSAASKTPGTCRIMIEKERSSIIHLAAESSEATMVNNKENCNEPPSISSPDRREHNLYAGNASVKAYIENRLSSSPRKAYASPGKAYASPTKASEVSGRFSQHGSMIMKSPSPYKAIGPFGDSTSQHSNSPIKILETKAIEPCVAEEGQTYEKIQNRLMTKHASAFEHPYQTMQKNLLLNGSIQSKALPKQLQKAQSLAIVEPNVFTRKQSCMMPSTGLQSPIKNVIPEATVLSDNMSVNLIKVLTKKPTLLQSDMSNNDSIIGQTRFVSPEKQQSLNRSIQSILQKKGTFRSGLKSVGQKVLETSPSPDRFSQKSGALERSNRHINDSNTSYNSRLAQSGIQMITQMRMRSQHSDLSPQPNIRDSNKMSNKLSSQPQKVNSQSPPKLESHLQEGGPRAPYNISNTLQKVLQQQNSSASRAAMIYQNSSTRIKHPELFKSVSLSRGNQSPKRLENQTSPKSINQDYIRESKTKAPTTAMSPRLKKSFGGSAAKIEQIIKTYGFSDVKSRESIGAMSIKRSRGPASINSKGSPKSVIKSPKDASNNGRSNSKTRARNSLNPRQNHDAVSPSKAHENFMSILRKDDS